MEEGTSASETHRGSSLFRRINSLFGRETFPVPIGREFARKTLELLRELTSKSAKMPGNTQIPCYFPCYQGIRGSGSIMSPQRDHRG
jgi:hypothetical protein